MVNDGALFSGVGPFISYQQALKAGEFKIQKCEGCGKHIYYPRSLCNHCGSPCLAWVNASGKGTVYSTSIVRQKPDQGPDYNIALVDLEEGPRMLTRIVDIKPEEIRIGMKVQGVVGEVDGLPAVVFRANTGGQH